MPQQPPSTSSAGSASSSLFLIARCQQWAAQHYPAESAVTQTVALSGLPERSFKRRYQPLARRLREAQAGER